MKLNWSETKGGITTLVLAGAALLVVSCADGGSTKSTTPKPDPNMERPQEEAKRDRERSRKEMAELVKEIEELHKKKVEVLGEHAAMKDAPGALEARHRLEFTAIGGDEFQEIKINSFRQRLKELPNDQLSTLGPRIASEYRTATKHYQQAVKNLEAAKKIQQ